MKLQEIERKFLVKDNSYRNNADRVYAISQGYLNPDPDRCVRVRAQGERGFLTVKGASTMDGTTRFEWEREIPVEEAKVLLKMCRPALIEKTRYEIKVDGYTFEVDEFAGVNHGLIVAEIELTDVDEDFPIPHWLGEEVTGDQRYYNAQLSRVPYCIWGNAGLFSAQ